MDQIVQILKALGDDNRLKILIMLSRRRICAKGIARHLGISEATVSQHIKVLKEAGIISGEKVGYYVHYDVNNAVLQEVERFIAGIMGNIPNEFSNYGVQIPNDCQVICKAAQNKCCHIKGAMKGE